MSEIRELLLDTLKSLKGGGKFVCSDTADFVFPGLEIEGLGEVSFPVTATGAQALLAQAQQAPFGKGSETIVDENIRKTREIDASLLKFRNPAWARFLDETLRSVKSGLGIESYDIEARPYKLLIYETGSFFLPHKDSEKEKGMFGTLVIELPSKHTGGELLLRFDGREERVSFAGAQENYQLGYAAFYADCEHEIRPVTSGYRISLVYNLIQKGAGEPIHASSVSQPAKALGPMLRRLQEIEEPKPLIVLLGHQYTPENFAGESLKLDDRIKAAALVQAAAGNGYHARLCLVSSFLEGSPEYSGGGTYYGDDDGDDGEMGEVHNEGLSIEHWANDGFPVLGNIVVEEDDLVAAFELNEGEPLIKESSGYMGNYGPDLTFWYHYGAVMIWSPELNVRLLAQQDTDTQLAWIEHFAQHRGETSEIELESARYLMATGFGDYRSNRGANMNPVADWIMSENDKGFFNRISAGVAQSYLNRIDTAHWLRLIPFFGEDESIAIFDKILEDGNVSVLERLLDILCALQKTGAAPELFTSQTEALPEYFARALSAPTDRLSAAGLKSLLELTQKLRQPAARIYELAHLVTRHVDRKYIHHVLGPALLKGDPDAPLSAALRIWTREKLTEMTAEKPQPPRDWAREVPVTWVNAKVWPELQRFLQSPTEMVYDFRAVQKARTDLEEAIGRVTIDLKKETIRKGSPHILRLTKTQAAYELELKRWEEDRLLLAGLPV